MMIRIILAFAKEYNFQFFNSQFLLNFQLKNFQNIQFFPHNFRAENIQPLHSTLKTFNFILILKIKID